MNKNFYNKMNKMNKSFLELEVGDYIWYYDHCKLYKQLVKSIEHEVENNKWRDYMGRECTMSYQYIIIKAGRGSVLKILDAPYNRDTIRENGMVRFSSYEAAKRFLKEKIEYRRKRVEKFKDKYEQEYKILCKIFKTYENL